MDWLEVEFALCWSSVHKVDGLEVDFETDSFI